MQMAAKASPAEDVNSTEALSEFLASIRYESLPTSVVARTEELFLDWLASALAGRGARPVAAIQQFATMMGPAQGASEILTNRRRSSPFFAALVNGARRTLAARRSVTQIGKITGGRSAWASRLSGDRAIETSARGRFR